MNSGDMWMTMDAEGHVYGSYVGAIFLIGTSGREAIENLCAGKQPPMAEPHGEDEIF